MGKVNNINLSISNGNSDIAKPSLADRLYEAWKFAGNLGRRKH